MRNRSVYCMAALMLSFTTSEAFALCLDTFRNVSGKPGASCERNIKKTATLKGIEKCLRGLPHGKGGMKDAARFARDPDIIANVKILSLRSSSERCNGDVRVVVKDSVLAQKVEHRAASRSGGASVQSTPVGAVVRTLIDGKIAEEKGFNTLFSIQVLQQELTRRGFELVSLRDASMRFAKGKYTQTVNINAAPKELPPDKVRAYQSLRDDTRQAVSQAMSRHGAEYVELKRFDWLLAGEVNLRANGRDAQSGEYRYEVTGQLDVVDMQTMEQIATAAGAGAGKGINRDAAWSNSIQDWIEGRSVELVRQMRVYRANTVALGNRYTLIIVGATNGRKHVRPVIKALAAEDIRQIGARSDTLEQQTSKTTVIFKGSHNAFDDALEQALVRLEQRFPNIDSRLNGGVVQVILNQKTR